jgi:anaerobic C4-dicarboxylate transporter
MKLDFKKFLKGHKSSHKQLFHSPVTIWRTMLISTFVLLLSVAIFSFFIFTKVSNDDFINKNIDSRKAPELINRKKLDQVLQKFDDRAKASVQILTNPIVVSDPSK